MGGSTAEAEREWSMAGHVLTDHCSCMSPLIFELIKYLKYNSLYVESLMLWRLTRGGRVSLRRPSLPEYTEGEVGQEEGGAVPLG